MADGKKALIQAHRNNIGRYQRLLKTRLTSVERRYIEGRLSEERSARQAVVGLTLDTDFHNWG